MENETKEQNKEFLNFLKEMLSGLNEFGKSNEVRISLPNKKERDFYLSVTLRSHLEKTIKELEK